VYTGCSGDALKGPEADRPTEPARSGRAGTSLSVLVSEKLVAELKDRTAGFSLRSFSTE
jgi:hypothetical protein